MVVKVTAVDMIMNNHASILTRILRMKATRATIIVMVIAVVAILPTTITIRFPRSQKKTM